MSKFDFIAIDFETATKNPNSACAIGIAAVKGDKIVDTYYSLIQPPDNAYDVENISVHGITPAMTENAPSFYQVWWDGACSYFGSSLVIAHNAHFDISVLHVSLGNATCTNFKYVDSISIAKKYVPGSKSLSSCADFFSIPMGQHHNALDDAKTCAQIVIHCLERSRCSNIGELCFSSPNIKIHNFSDIQQQATAHPSQRPTVSKVRPKDIAPTSTCFNPEHPLYQKTIVFTGDLSISRKDAMQLAVDVGARVTGSVSGKTHYLVVGKQDIRLVGSDGMSDKEEKAHELINSGKANIKIINEAEFLSLVYQGEMI